MTWCFSSAATPGLRLKYASSNNNCRALLFLPRPLIVCDLNLPPPVRHGFSFLGPTIYLVFIMHLLLIVGRSISSLRLNPSLVVLFERDLDSPPTAYNLYHDLPLGAMSCFRHHLNQLSCTLVLFRVFLTNLLSVPSIFRELNSYLLSTRHILFACRRFIYSVRFSDFART